MIGMMEVKDEKEAHSEEGEEKFVGDGEAEILESISEVKKNQVLKTDVFKLKFLFSHFISMIIYVLINLSEDTHRCVLPITIPDALASCSSYVLVVVNFCLFVICCVYALIC